MGQRPGMKTRSGVGWNGTGREKTGQDRREEKRTCKNSGATACPPISYMMDNKCMSDD